MFQGNFVALVTPFREGAVDHKALEELVDFVLSHGVDGLVPCGTTGEAPCLSAAEQEAVIRTVVKRNQGSVPVIAGTGTNWTAGTVKATRSAVQAGVDGVMLVAPYYNKPSQKGLYEHFSAVASQVDIPIVLYNIPGRSGVEISIDTIARLHESHSNIVAVKHATGSIEGASILSASSDIAILSGDDMLTLPLISIGAVGGVSVLANLMPSETTSLVAAALGGNPALARRWHEHLFPLAHGLLTMATNPIPIKTALAIKGMMAEEFRLPMCAMDVKQRSQLESLLESTAATGTSRQIA